MTVKEIMKENKEKFDAFEVWAYTDPSHRLHTDFITNVDEEYSKAEYENKEAVHYEIMDESEYDNSILANSNTSADFAEWYDSANAKVLVIVLDENWREEPEELKEITDTKIKIAELIVSLPGFNGNKNTKWLCEHNTEEQLQELLDAYDSEFSGQEYEGTEYELTESQHKKILSAHDKFDKENTQRVSLKLNKNTDAEILEWLNRQKSKQGAIKNAIMCKIKSESNGEV